MKTVLVPADLSANTDLAIARAIQWIGDEGADLHLLHVFRCLPLVNNGAAYSERVRKLEGLKQSLEVRQAGLSVHCHLREAAFVAAAVRQAAGEIRPEMIVLGQLPARRGWFSFQGLSPAALAKATGAAVLTIAPGAAIQPVRTVIVPVSTDRTGGKIRALEVLCRQARLNIHLITLVDDRNALSDFSASSLLQMYQWLKTALRCSVEYAVVHGRNKAKAILMYAQKADADLLLVEPGDESDSGWSSRHVSDLLPRQSRMQVLTVATDY